MDFELYNVATGGSALWSDSFDPVTVTNGRFSVVLGSKVALPDSVFQTPTLYLQIAVDDSGGSAPVVLGSRQRIHASPFAVRTERARYADQADWAVTATSTQHGVPTGTMMIWPGDSHAIPDGWLPANGACMEISRNPDLYATIGSTGAWDQASAQPCSGLGTTRFALPDMRGQFLRGADQVYWINDPSGSGKVDVTTLGLSYGVGRDPDEATRVGGYGAEKVGSRQGDELRSHTHSWSWRDANGGNGDSSDGWDTGTDLQGTRWKTTTAYGGNETRPRNVYVHFIIKCGPNDACP
ncbi:MAG: tail fiber protein [Candidatus Dadabacteria bacterium]|nr:MAG: tail fiber protein [Candidatus Dadabacteria bacterium]